MFKTKKQSRSKDRPAFNNKPIKELYEICQLRDKRSLQVQYPITSLF